MSKSMDELMGGAFSLPVLKRGDVIKGTIIEIINEEALVDLGTKAEGILPKAEVKNQDLSPGQEVFVYVLTPESRRGQVIVSLSKAEAAKAWIDLNKFKETNKTFSVEVLGHNKGGLIVDVSGLRGFLPFSHLEHGPESETDRAELQSALDKMRDMKLEVKLIELDREQNRIIVSERSAQEDAAIEKQEEILRSVKKGDIFVVVVKDVMPYGVVVEYKGVEGLIEEEDLSWDPKVGLMDFSQGQELQAKVVEVNAKNGGIRLSIKEVAKDPWLKAKEFSSKNKPIKGTIRKITSFGIYIELEKGVEGLLPLTDLPEDKKALTVGDTISVVIDKLDEEKRQINLVLANGKK